MTSTTPVTECTFQACILVPVYNHQQVVATTLSHLLTENLAIILIDDGSGAECRRVLERLAQSSPLIQLLRLPVNRGKGGALKAGLRAARDRQFSHALQIDADGQHDTADLKRFITTARENPAALICGHPIYDNSVPSLRFYARYLTHIWVWINSLSLAVKDSMCGFRVYPVTAITSLLEQEAMGNRMEFESEIAVRWVWRNGPVINLPTKVAYPEDGVSHFAPWRDNLLISKMHATLFFGMLWRCPRLLCRKFKKQQSPQGERA